MKTATNPIEITVRAKAFTGEGVREHRVLVEGGKVSVWDSVAGHYTTCHSLSAAAVKRIARKATR
jgi:hypothetical protein